MQISIVFYLETVFRYIYIRDKITTNMEKHKIKPSSVIRSYIDIFKAGTILVKFEILGGLLFFLIAVDSLILLLIRIFATSYSI